MENKIKTVICSSFCILLCACNSYDFQQEQYKNELYLLSNSEMVYDRQVAELKEGGDTIYLVAGLSGSQPTGQTHNIALIEADSLFHAFNKSNFDIEKDRYARILPRECYTFPSMEMQIPAGQSSVKFPIYLKNLDLLSPDSIYLLNYKIDPQKSSPFNKKKDEVLLRIYKKNKYTTTEKNISYNYTTSFVITTNGSSSIIKRPTNANRVFPLAENTVRMLAGDETFGEYKKALDKINKMSIKIEIGEKTQKNPLARTLKIEAYNTIDVVQLTPLGIYDNTFLINVISTPDGRNTYYKEFRLHYKYRLERTDSYKEVKAILRREFSPRAELL